MNQYSQFIKTVHQKEAKRNATRSLARAAGVDPSALYKGSSTSIHVADVKEDGKWVTLKVKVVQIWDNTSDKITQTGLIGDETGIIRFHHLGIGKPAPDGRREILRDQERSDQPVQRKVPDKRRH